MAKTSIDRTAGSAPVLGGDRPGNFAEAVQSAGSKARVQGGQNPTTVGQGATPAGTISQIIHEAVRRAGITITDGRFSNADVAAINNEIRKDPALAAALAHARGDYKRGKGKLDDQDIAADTEANERSSEAQTDGADGGFGNQGVEAGAAKTASLYSNQPEAFNVSSSAVPVKDIANEMLKIFDQDGDGIITVRQVLEYFILHARDDIRFSEVEFANIMKVLTEGINQSGSNLYLTAEGKFIIKQNLAA